MVYLLGNINERSRSTEVSFAKDQCPVMLCESSPQWIWENTHRCSCWRKLCQFLFFPLDRCSLGSWGCVVPAWLPADGTRRLSSCTQLSEARGVLAQHWLNAKCSCIAWIAGRVYFVCAVMKQCRQTLECYRMKSQFVCSFVCVFQVPGPSLSTKQYKHLGCYIQ